PSQMRRLLLAASALLAAQVATAATRAANAESVLRVVPQADLRVLDPHVTAATITQIHARMIYDAPYTFDEAMNVHPQMVAKHEVSADGLTHSFTLRDGLKFN